MFSSWVWAVSYICAAASYSEVVTLALTSQWDNLNISINYYLFYWQINFVTFSLGLPWTRFFLLKYPNISLQWKDYFHFTGKFCTYFQFCAPFFSTFELRSSFLALQRIIFFCQHIQGDIKYLYTTLIYSYNINMWI